jgi:S-formylglutathione hydrolase FrmB
VYLPPGYATSGLRYPVVYLLHGGGGDQGDWVTQGSLQQTLDAAAATDPAHAVIAVTPDGRSGQWFDYYDGSFQLETYVLRYLIPYVDRHFNTIADRRGRVIDGLSNGGYGALHFAAKAPDLFVAAGSMSGNVGARTMSGLGTPIGNTGQQAQEAGAYYYGNVPISLVPNLDPVDLTIDWGATCSSDVTVDLCATYAFEQSFRLDNQAFRNELDAQGHQNYEYRETEGAHAWRWWSVWLRDRHLPFFFDRLSPPEPLASPLAISAPPASFRYRSIAAHFSVWGYDVDADRPVREFLDLTNVTVDGLSVRGTGGVTITTAGRYTPGATYRISGTGRPDASVVADGAGRLTVAIDLGPAHQVEQYSPEARAQEATGMYTFVERTISISPS